MKLCLILLIGLILQTAAAAQSVVSTTNDVDRDGLNDQFEQALLEKFVPRFLISADDCDGLPAEFLPGHSTPIVFAKNGTIYGQVSRHPGDGSNKAFLEVHYYHLWSRDCGRLGHDLDPEHISALIRADGIEHPPIEWKALYWYAAAHEDTVCDVSHAAPAEFLDAVENGSRIWVSKGKHGSFLSQSRCRFGCGENRCDDMTLMQPPRVINIGELGFPMNGAIWAQSERWALTLKMHTDFSAVTLAWLEDKPADSVVGLNASLPPAQALILGGNSSLGAFLKGNQSADRALSVATLESVDAVGKALTQSGKSLLLVGRKLRGLLGALYKAEK